MVGDRVEHQIDRHPREVGADAVVRAVAAESQVRVGFSHDVERERVVEDVFVEVRRAVEQHQPLTPFDLHATEFRVGEGRPLERGDRRRPADDLVGGGLGPLLFEQLPLVGEVGEGHHALGDGVAGRLVARDGQGDDEHAELGLGELAVGFGVDQRADDVVAGFLGLACRQLHGVPDQLGGRAQRVVLGELGVVVTDHLVGPVEQLAAVLQRHSEQSGDRLQRQFPGDLQHEVSGALFRGFCGDALCAFVELGAQPLDGTRREAAGDDLAQPGVLRIVHHDHRQRARLDLPAATGHFVPRHNRLLGRRENVAAQRHLAHVAMLADHPEAAVAETTDVGRLFVPPERRGPAQFGELLHRQALRVDVGIGEVEAGRQMWSGHHDLLRIGSGRGTAHR